MKDLIKLRCVLVLTCVECCSTSATDFHPSSKLGPAKAIEAALFTTSSGKSLPIHIVFLLQTKYDRLLAHEAAHKGPS